MASVAARALAPLAFTAIVCAAPRADALSKIDRQRLASGESVNAPTVHEKDGRRFVGGLSYRIVDADVERVSRIVRDPKRFPELFPRLHSASLLRVDDAGRAWIRFEHALGPVRGGYTAVLACTEKGRHCKFRLDRQFDNALDDGWGFVRLTPLPGGRTLVTWGVLFDLGGGMIRLLFESKIQRAALDFPRRLAHAAAH